MCENLKTNGKSISGCEQKSFVTTIFYSKMMHKIYMFIYKNALWQNILDNPERRTIDFLFKYFFHKQMFKQGDEMTRTQIFRQFSCDSNDRNVM